MSIANGASVKRYQILASPRVRLPIRPRWVVLGGAALSGGVGSVSGVALATLIIGCINNLLNQAGTSFYLQQVVTGLVILAVVAPGFSSTG